MTTLELETRQLELLQGRTDAQLVELWEGFSNVRTSDETPTIRGWIMDEFERRDAGKFDAWLESTLDSPRSFFL